MVHYYVVFIAIMLSGILIENRVYREILAFVLFALQVVNVVLNRVTIAAETSTSE